MRGQGAIFWLTLLGAISALRVGSADEPPTAPGPVESRDLETLADFTLEDLMRIETRSAAKMAQSASEAPALMTVVTRDQVQSYGYLSINDILYKQPGFAPSMDYDRRTVSARGLYEGWNNNHLLLLIDGVPVNDNVYGTAYTWEMTPLFMLRTLEIIRGPGSALYGSNATNGVLAINTRSADKLGPIVEGELRFGNANTQIYDVFAGHQFRLYSFVVGFNRYSSDGNSYDDYDASGRTDGYGGLAKFKVGDARSSDYVFAKLTVNGGLSLQFHYQDWSFQTGHGWIWYIPDQKESLNEQREIVSLTYHPRDLVDGRFHQQYVLRYQRHGIDWDLKFYPDGTQVDLNHVHYSYPNGLRESLVTQTHDIFARAEYSYRLWRDMTLLAGIENTVFIYTGDDSHQSNVNLNGNRDLMPFPDGLQHSIGPWLEYVRNRPVDNVGAYLQYTSGRFWKERIAVTAGVRDDFQSFRFVDITDPARPVLSRTFNQVSPRLGVIVHPWHELTLKALFDQAFRTPAPSELFGANTYTLGSAPKTLQPEQITTVSVSADWPVMRQLSLRVDWFYEIFDNQIQYSVFLANLSANLYSRTVTGVETELLFDTPIRHAGGLRGYFNYTYVYLVDEAIQDPTIAKSNVLTWAPAHTFNLGLNFVGHGFNASTQGHFQGAVERRVSDYTNPDGSLNLWRPRTVAPWFTVDARVSYAFAEWARLGVQASNLLNTRGAFVKNNNFPFDYQIEGVRVLGTIELDIRSFAR
jgi:iron complex outermembrane receptor protein